MSVVTIDPNVLTINFRVALIDAKIFQNILKKTNIGAQLFDNCFIEDLNNTLRIIS